MKQIDDRGQILWRNQRQEIYGKLQSIAQKTNIAYNQNLTDIHSVKSDKILYCHLFDLIPDFDWWLDINGTCEKLGKRIWVVTDNLIDVPPKYQFSNIRFFSFPELLGVTYRPDFQDIQPQETSRLYNCFMQRCESTRQSWFYFLWSNDILDKGYVSYLLYQLRNYSQLSGQDLFDYIHYQKGLHEVTDFDLAYQNLRDQVPFRNFQENNNLAVYILQSKYSVILETYAIDDDRGQWCFTEKSLRHLQLPCINLLFSQKHAASMLKKLQLEIDPVNFKFDHLDWIQRQQIILEILTKDTVVESQQLQQARSQHNREILCHWQKSYHESNFFDKLLDDFQ
jgi:hypothetical protein